MAKKLSVVNKLRPKIISQGNLELEDLAGRIAKNTTFNKEEIYTVLRLFVSEANAALQAGERLKIDGLVSINANMKVGGKVNMALRGDRGAVAALNNPLLWNADKVSNHANLGKSTEELVALWNQENPADLVEE